MTTRQILPSRSRMPTGNALPPDQTGESLREAYAQCQQLREELKEQTPKPLWSSDEEYEQLIDERMRTMNTPERYVLEVEKIARGRRAHSADYDPLAYDYAYGYDPAPVYVGETGVDNWGPELTPPQPAAPTRGWYDK